MMPKMFRTGGSLRIAKRVSPVERDLDEQKQIGKNERIEKNNASITNMPAAKANHQSQLRLR
jgi:hypothetical protein